MKHIVTVLFLLQFYANHVSAQVRPDHTIILILENHSYNEIYGNASAPYINSILNDTNTAVLTQSFALTHPSQPNYIMLFSGSNQGVINDNKPTTFPFTAPNLGAYLIQNGFSFFGYSETMPSVGYNNATSGKYARKHNPWVNWQGTGTNGIPASQNVPFTYFPQNLDSLPSLSFVIPNLDNDMHDGTIAMGDAWIKANMNTYIQWCKTHNSLFVLTVDEDDASQNNQILTAIVGQNIKAGNYNQPITHYNVLRTLAELYKIPYPGASVDSSAIKHIWINKEFCPGSTDILTADISGNTYQWQVNSGNGFKDISDNNFYSGTKSDTLQLNNIPSSWYGNQYRVVVDGTSGNPETIFFIDYWNGVVSNNWEDPGNWSCGTLPDSNTDVVINSAKPVLLNSNTTVRSLKVSIGSSFTITAPYKITVMH